MSFPNLARSVAEQATRKLVFTRRLPEPFSDCAVLVSPSGGLRFLLRRMTDVDPNLFALVSELVRPGMVVWDVGANLGLFSFAAAAAAGPRGGVLAFEADTWLVDLLRRSSELQPERSARVTVVPSAVASDVDLRTFCLAKRSRSANFLAGYGSTQTGGSRAEQTVVSVSLDWVACRRTPPDILKVDVEGAELEVLQGAHALLEKHRPIVLCEVGASPKELSDLLHGHGYWMYDADSPLRPRPRILQPAWNTLALPGPL